VNDEGWELATERKRGNIDSRRQPSSGDPRPLHVRNFLDCCQSRRQPVLNLELGHRVSALAHLGNIAYRTGHKIVWDAVAEKVAGDDEANRLVCADYREPWQLPGLRRA
jgi:hypothetical protein